MDEANNSFSLAALWCHDATWMTYYRDPEYIEEICENCRSKGEKRGPLTTSEVNGTETWLIKQDRRVALT
ncbi:hypothetical protein TNCV_3726561 [Trichonephila clavipes]|nr:hypothetical protein TNCV_3726561 [Trichonephila clavipes]